MIKSNNHSATVLLLLCLCCTILIPACIEPASTIVVISKTNTQLSCRVKPGYGIQLRYIDVLRGEAAELKLIRETSWATRGDYAAWLEQRQIKVVQTVDLAADATGAQTEFEFDLTRNSEDNAGLALVGLAYGGAPAAKFRCIYLRMLKR